MKTARTDSHADALHDEAHAWFITPESVADPTTLQRCYAMLDAHEREKFSRFISTDDSHRYLVSHALVRSVLSRYTDIAPCDWCFSQGPYGRPEVIPVNQPRLRFNLTHTSGLAACIVTFDDDCGIDAELISERHNPTGVAERMFSVSECLEMRQLEDAAQLDYFFTRWTLREAYVKARGIGISFPTRKLHFRVDDEARVGVMFEGELQENELDWRFHLLRPTPKHIAAIAVRTGNQPEKKLLVRTIEL